MPWQEVNKMSLRKEFVLLALNESSNISELCNKYNISRTLGYKLLNRYQSEGLGGLKDKSKRPKSSPKKTQDDVEKKVLEVRDKHYSWGGRKIHYYLKNNGFLLVPHPNTITDILRRHGRLYEWSEKDPKKPYCSFERSQANELWQMDFKGHFSLINGRCYPLTIIDDHSRFAVMLDACINERKETVRSCLVKAFMHYGLPCQINTDNGNPWGTGGGKGLYSELAIWMMRLGIRVTYSAPYHPQTNGKDERFHRSLKQEVLNRYTITTLSESQKYFDSWREVYNTERPHEAIGYEVPINRYKISGRRFPEGLPTIEYLDDDIVYKVNKSNGCIIFKGKQIYIGYPFMGEPIALRADNEADGVYNVFYCQQKIKVINLRDAVR